MKKDPNKQLPEKGQADEPEPLPPTIGRFRILERLGEGGMGTAYKAMDPQDGRTVVVKTARPPGNKKREGDIRHEAEILSLLKHPHIIPFLEQGDDNGPFIVLPFCSGGSLNKRLVHPLSPEESLSFAWQIACALEEVHRNGFIHRDVKPGNILLDGEEGSEEQVLLADFALACRVPRPDTIAEEGEEGGTPLYMAPEAVLSPRIHDGRGDLYSLGVVLYEMVTGVRPFRGSGMEDIISRVLFMEPIPPRRLNPSLPEAVEAVVMKAMDKTRERRYQTAREMAEELKKELEKLRA